MGLQRHQRPGSLGPRGNVPERVCSSAQAASHTRPKHSSNGVSCCLQVAGSPRHPFSPRLVLGRSLTAPLLSAGQDQTGTWSKNFQTVCYICLKNRISNLGQTLPTSVVCKPCIVFFKYLGLTLSRCLHQTQPLLADLLGSCQGPVSGFPLLEVGVLSSTPRRPHPWCPEPGGLFLLKLNTAPPQGSGHSPGHTWAFPPPLVTSPACSTFMAVPPFLCSFTRSPCLGRCTSWVHSPPAESVPGPMGSGHLAENLP